VVLDDRPLSRRASLAHLTLALLLATGCLVGPVRLASSLGDRLAERADPYSEANALRGAEAYLQKGWLADASLPETTYGRLYPEIGHIVKFSGKRYVDTHYPPGPTWLAAGMRVVCGAQPVSCLRTLPLAVSAAGAFALAFALLAVFGTSLGLALAVAAFAVPLYTDMMLGLHYQGYALALLSVQLAGLLLVYGTGRAPAARDLALAAGVGFAQGWLSFDYFFLVALAPLPIAILFSDLREREAQRRLLVLVAASGGGFAFAHGLHFLQVVAYYGDFGAAVRDLLAVAGQRADPQKSAAEPPPAWASDPWMLSSIYLFVLALRPAYFGFAVGYLLSAAFAVLALLRGMRVRLPGTQRELALSASTRPALALAAGVVVSCAWISVMPGHGHTHPHFLPRHLFLAWLMLLLALASAVRVAPVGARRG
jgi:hypothetical protein